MTVKILRGDCRQVLATLPEQSVHCVVTSPPYWGLRDYGVDGQIGLEQSVDDWLRELVDVFREVRRVLRDDGTVWLNLGDSYNAGTFGARKPTDTGKHGYWENPNIAHRVNAAGLKAKDLIGQPWRAAFALQADGWYLRQDIIWSKPNPMPESIRDRCTKAHEYLFLLSKSERYFFNFDAMQEPVNGGAHARRPSISGWASGDTPHTAIAHQQAGVARVPAGEGVGRRKGPPGNPAERKLAPAGSGTKNNASMDEALALMPATRNRRSVWTIPTEPFKEAHFATYPTELVRPCIEAGCPLGGVVLDPFGGSGTTGLVADRLGRDAILIELNPEYAAMAERRIAGDKMNAAKRTPCMFAGEAA